MKTYFLINEIFRYINRRRKFQLFLCFILILLSGIADMVSIASVIPFLNVILNPDALLDNQFVLQYTNLSKLSYENLLLTLTIIFILCSWISTIIRLTNLWFYNKISAKVGSDIGTQAFQKVITLPYSFHLKNNTSQIINLLTFHIDQVTYTVRNFFQIISLIIISICIIGLLLIYQFKVTFSLLLIILFSYTLIVFFIKPLIVKFE